MDAFEQMEEEIRRREEALKARELKVRLKEIEHELSDIPVQPTYKHNEAASQVSAKQKTRSLTKKVVNIGKFCLIVVAVIMAIRIAAWASTILLVFGISWIAYKLFVDTE